MGESRIMDGILVIDKPQGATSHDVVAVVRRAAKTGKVGHAGTLDPMATGVLVVAIGQATRTLEYLTAHDKRYTATIRLGQNTTTYDAEGEVTYTHQGDLPPFADIEKAVASQRGTIPQVPPIFSAIKQDGEPLYAKARRGEAVEVAARNVTIYALDVVEWSPPDLTVEVHCSKGTYIRSIAYDIGKALGVGGHLTALRRTSSGSFTEGQTQSLEAVRAATPTMIHEWLLPVGTGLEALPILSVTAPDILALQQGKSLPATEGAGIARALDERGQLIAIVEWREGRGWKPEKVFT
jgi:tRNA pseudouridine55 synthase